MDALALPLGLPVTGYEVRWFAANCCVIERGGECRIMVAGSLIGTFDVEDRDRGPRNILAVTLAKAPGMHLRRLAIAFGISEEYLRILRRKEEDRGIGAVITGRAGGRGKLSAERIADLHRDFAAGVTPAQARTAQPRRGRVSYQTIWREHQRWLELVESARPPVAPPSRGQLTLFAAPPAAVSSGEANDESIRVERLVSRPVRGGRLIQHLGTWLMMALCRREGLHEEAARVDDRPGDGLRIALDAAIATLALGERCVEGVRRLATPSAPLLLRVDHTPTASGVRRRLWRLGENGGGVALQYPLHEGRPSGPGLMLAAWWGDGRDSISAAPPARPRRRARRARAGCGARRTRWQARRDRGGRGRASSTLGRARGSGPSASRAGAG
jgi:hypothetical protein